MFSCSISCLVVYYVYPFHVLDGGLALASIQQAVMCVETEPTSVVTILALRAVRPK